MHMADTLGRNGRKESKGRRSMEVTYYAPNFVFFAVDHGAPSN